jgi:hypothetical protein
VEIANPVCFVEAYLVYSEMFIPKITTGVLEESYRVSHTCPFNPNTNYLSKLDAQDEAPIFDAIRNRLTLSFREVCCFPIPSPTKGPTECRQAKQSQAEGVMEKDLYPHVNLFSDWLCSLASLTKVKMRFRGTKMEPTRPKPRFPCVK